MLVVCVFWFGVVLLCIEDEYLDCEFLMPSELYYMKFLVFCIDFTSEFSDLD